MTPRSGDGPSGLRAHRSDFQVENRNGAPSTGPPALTRPLGHYPDARINRTAPGTPHGIGGLPLIHGHLGLAQPAC